MFILDEVALRDVKGPRGQVPQATLILLLSDAAAKTRGPSVVKGGASGVLQVRDNLILFV